MRSITRMIGLIAILLLTALPALAQEAEEAAESTVKGMHLFMLLGGLIAVGFVGIIMYRRESSGSDDELV